MTSINTQPQPRSSSLYTLSAANQPAESIVMQLLRTITASRPKPPSALSTALLNQSNWQVLANKLQAVTKDLIERSLVNDPLSKAEVASRLSTVLATHLKDTLMSVDAGSSYYKIHALTPDSRVSLESFIKDNGLNVPTSLDALLDLSKTVDLRAATPPLGDFGGGFSWPVPMKLDDQKSIVSLLQSNSSSLPGLPLADVHKGALAYLLSGSSVTASDLQNPRTALQQLLDSPRAIALGQAIQTRLEGAPTETSVYEYALTAIHLGLDPESMENPARNTVAGFNLAQSAHWGLPAAAIIEGLGRHLIEKGRVTAGTADLAARLLLGKTFPHLLVKDIPSSVTYGSVTWTQLTTAAAKLEAQTPGRVQNMTYAQVIASAEGMTGDSPAVESAQREALRDWGVVNGMLTASTAEPTDSEFEAVRVAYNSQMTALMGISSSMQTPMPSRRDIALFCLKTEFPGVDPKVFEAKVLKRRYASNGRAPALYPELRSMLDIAMEGEKLKPNYTWITEDRRIPINAFNTYARSDHLHVTSVFTNQFEAAVKAQGEGHHGMVKYMISKLPLDDRMNFESGKLEFFHTNDYKMAMDFTSPLALSKRGHTLQVKTTREGEVNIYEIDTSTGTVKKQNYLTRKFTEPYSQAKLDERNASTVSRTKLFDPYDGARTEASTERPGASTPPKSYSSSRTDYIADVFVKSLALDNEDLLNHAKGVSSFDSDRAQNAAIGEFFLNLIPLRSAIVNFQKGDVGAGLSDLSLDVVGLITLGFGKAAQATKAVGKGLHGLSTAAKAAKAAKFIGVAAIDALNPLGGLGVALAGGAKLIGKGYSKSVEWLNKLRGASGSDDVLKAVSNEHGTALIGSYTAANRSIDTVAVLKNDQWYHYNPAKNEIYGSPIKDFKPIGGSEPQTLGAHGLFEHDYQDLRRNIESARASGGLTEFNNGYTNGSLQNVSGYSVGMNTDALRMLASQQGRTAREMGILARELKKSILQDAHYSSRLLSNDVHAPGVNVTPVSQMHYLAHVDLTSRGECAGLSNIMAWAVQQGKENVLMQNLYRAAANPTDPKAATFIRELRNLQNGAGQKYSFHMSKPQTKTPYQDIIEDLTNSPGSKTLRIGTKDHAMIAGIKVEGGKTDWFFYEPNSGMVTFKTLQSMQEGMEKALNSGNIAAMLHPYGSKRGAREYYVSAFAATDFDIPGINKAALQNLFDTAL